MSRAHDCKSNLLLKAEAVREGYTSIINRGEMSLKHTEFGLLRLSSGEWAGESGNCEQVFDIHAGTVSIEITSPVGKLTRRKLGDRTSLLDGAPTMVYIPPNTAYWVKVEEAPVEMAVFSANAPGHSAEPVIVGPDDAIRESIDRESIRSEGCISIGDNVSAARLIVGETVIAPGNWSGFPPHKHDAFNPPNELVIEEICYFRTNPREGYGIMRIYTQPNDPSPLNEVYVVEDGDAVIIPRGYHSVVAAPGYSLHCTWGQAGDIRKHGAWSIDRRHAWLRDA